MPEVSFVVIAYDVESTLGRCLASIQNQTFTDFEVIVVDDGSSDGTRALAEHYSDSDGRFKVVVKSSNEGAHLARKTGVGASQGVYVVFVDGDDEVAPTALEALLLYARSQKFDMLRFGREVIASGSELAETAANDEFMFNCSPRRLEGVEILQSAFSEWGNSHATWSIIDVLFAGDFLRAAFADMTTERLGRTQDAYEMFVVMSRAQLYLAYQECRVLLYHLGDGVSGHSLQSISQFRAGQEGMYSSLSALLGFASASGDALFESCATWYANRLYDTIATEFTSRIAEDDEAGAFGAIRDIWGDEVAALVILSPLNGRLEWLIEQDDEDSYHMDIYMLRWQKLFGQLAVPVRKSEALRNRLARYYQLEDVIARRIEELDFEQGSSWRERHQAPEATPEQEPESQAEQEVAPATSPTKSFWQRLLDKVSASK